MDDLLAGAGQRLAGAEEEQRMLDGHQRQGHPRHARHQRSPDPAGDDDERRLDVAPRRLHAVHAPVADVDRGRRGVGERPQAAALHAPVDEEARDVLRARHHETGVGIPHRTLDAVLLHPREAPLGLARRYQAHVGAERLAGGDLALDLLHARVVPDPHHFQAALLHVVAEALVELAAVDRRVA